MIQFILVVTTFAALTLPLAFLSGSCRLCAWIGLVDERIAMRVGATFWARSSRLLLRLLRIRIPEIDVPEGSFLVANHLSWLDGFVIAAAHRCTIVTKGELSSYAGFLTSSFGALAVRTDGPEPLPDAIDRCHRYLDAGISVLVFPEGTPRRQGDVGRFHAPFFEVPLDRESTLVVLAIRYETADGFPAWVDAEPLLTNLRRVVMASGTGITANAVCSRLTAGSSDRLGLAREARTTIIRALGKEAREDPELRPVDAAITPGEHREVLGKIARACQVTIEEVTLSETFEGLGLDSLTLLQLAHELQHLGWQVAGLTGLGSSTTVREFLLRLRRDDTPSAAASIGTWLFTENPFLGFFCRGLLPGFAFALWLAAGAVTATLVRALPLGDNDAYRLAAAVGFFLVAFPLIAGLASLPFQWSIRPLACRTSLGVPIYAARRFYGICWTSLYYFQPAYALVLAIPVLKGLVFRAFGYRGSLRFTTYPDTWIRDLPLLHLSANTYLSNRATLGTNVIVGNGTIVVGPIRVGAGGLVGHMAVLGPQSSMGRGAKLGVGAQLGIGTSIGARSDVGPYASIHNYAALGRRCAIGGRAYVGMAARIDDDIAIPGNGHVPDAEHVRSADPPLPRVASGA